MGSMSMLQTPTSSVRSGMAGTLSGGGMSGNLGGMSSSGYGGMSTNAAMMHGNHGNHGGGMSGMMAQNSGSMMGHSGSSSMQMMMGGSGGGMMMGNSMDGDVSGSAQKKKGLKSSLGRFFSKKEKVGYISDVR